MDRQESCLHVRLDEVACGGMFISDIVNNKGEKIVTPSNVATISVVVNALQNGRYPRVPVNNSNPSSLLSINMHPFCDNLFLPSLRNV